MKAKRAFSLIELLVVVAIIVILLTMAIPALTGIMKGSQLTQAGQLVTGQLGLARQTAIAQNVSVEVRFYKCGYPETPGSSLTNPTTWTYSALQTFANAGSGVPIPLGKVMRLPPGTVMNSTPALSSLLNLPRSSYPATTYALPEVGTNYTYFALRFHPAGSTDLPTTSAGANQVWFVTVHNATDGPNRTSPPHNFWTIQIDPINGNVMSYRP